MLFSINSSCFHPGALAFIRLLPLGAQANQLVRGWCGGMTTRLTPAAHSVPLAGGLHSVIAVLPHNSAVLIPGNGLMEIQNGTGDGGHRGQFGWFQIAG